MAILGDPEAVSRVGGNGTARNTDCPWISKDDLLNKFLISTLFSVEQICLHHAATVKYNLILAT